MKIKSFDMVKYDGVVRRVMLMSPHDDNVYVAGFGCVPLVDVELIESVFVDTFSPGDQVRIKDIPLYEMKHYPHIWKKPMTKMLLHEERVYTISEKSQICERYKIDDMWFAPYHLEKVTNFDMV